MAAKKVSGKRVYVTFLKDGTIAVHPSNCTGRYYRMRGEGSIHLPKKTTPATLGKIVFDMRNKCRTNEK
jgi:DnaJ-class molecular chaperone